MDGASLVEAARASFDMARRAAGSETVRGSLAGRGVAIECAGTFFGTELRNALAFLGPAAGTPSLRIHAWDAASSGVGLTWDEQAWQGRPPDIGPAGIIRGLGDRYHASIGFNHSVVSLLDAATGEAYHVTPDPTRMPYWERTHPLRLLLSAWGRTHGLLVCHAAAVAHQGQGVLLVGPGGSGKSTTALACLRAGMESAGDDYVAVEPAGTPSVHALYTSTLLEHGHAQRNAGLMPAVDRVEEDAQIGRRKAVMYATGGQRPRISAGFTVVALVAARVERGSVPQLIPTTPGTVLRALAPSTLGQLGMVDAVGLRGLSELCRRLPGYELRLGDDPATVPDLLRGLVEQLAAPAPRSSTAQLASA